jgi:hypothetical protein
VIGLDPVVGVLLGAVPGRRQQVLQHDRVGCRSVGPDLHWHHLGGVEGPFEEPPGCLSVALWSDEHVDDLPELVDRAIDVPPLPSDLHIRLVHLPAVPDAMPTWPGGFGQQRREALDPPVNGDVVDCHSALSQEFFDVAVGQTEA